MKKGLLALIIFFASPLPHEFAHAIIAIIFGFKVYGFGWGFPVSFVLLTGGNFWVGIAGGLANAIPLLCIFKFGRNYINTDENMTLLWFIIFYFLYAIVEGIGHI
jgi:hypothetical protein